MHILYIIRLYKDKGIKFIKRYLNFYQNLNYESIRKRLDKIIK